MGVFSDFVGSVVSKSAMLIATEGRYWFKEYLRNAFKKMFIKASIKYVLIFVGIALVIFEPFGFFVCNLIASLIFISVLVWSLISAIKIIVNYYMLPVFIIRNRSIEEGAREFISYKWPKVDVGVKGYNAVKRIGSRFSEKFRDMPEIENTVKDFLRFVLKDFIILSLSLVLYFVTVNLFAKPFLLLEYAGLHIWEVYLFPFVQIKEFILYLI